MRLDVGVEAGEARPSLEVALPLLTARRRRRDTKIVVLGFFFWAYEKHWRTNTAWGASPERDRRARRERRMPIASDFPTSRSSSAAAREQSARPRARGAAFMQPVLWQWLLLQAGAQRCALR